MTQTIGTAKNSDHSLHSSNDYVRMTRFSLAKVASFDDSD